jgi:hypothetical protein
MIHLGRRDGAELKPKVADSAKASSNRRQSGTPAIAQHTFPVLNSWRVRRVSEYGGILNPRSAAR